MASAAIQLHTLRDVEESLPALLERVASAGFEGVEFAFRVGDADENDVAEALGDFDLQAVAAHVPIERLEDDASGAAAVYREFGCEALVVPHLDAEYFRTREDVDRAADRLTAVDDALPPGIDLLYHNHDHEFVEVDPDARAVSDASSPAPHEGYTAYEALVDAAHDRIGFELDVGHAARAGVDPVELLARIGDRVRLLHLTDVDLDADEDVPLGEGDVDLAACAREFRERGGRWLVYEYEGPTPLGTIEGAAEFVAGMP